MVAPHPQQIAHQLQPLGMLRFRQSAPVEHGAVAGRLHERIGDFIAMLGVVLGKFLLAPVANGVRKVA